MIDARENIHYNQFLKLSSTYWSVVVNGEGCLTTIPRGKVSIITTINGDKRVVSSISLRNSSERYVANAVRHQVRVLARWMPKASNGGADREITDMTATKKSRVSKEISSPTAMASSLRGKSVTPVFTIQKWLMSYADWRMMYGKTCARYCATEGIGETWTKTLKKTSASSLRYPIPPMELRDSCQSRSDGWLRGLSHGLILAADSLEIMKYQMNQRKK